MAPFRPVPNPPDFPAMEAEVLARWEAHNVFRRSVDARPMSDSFTFFDGPPFATGLPHYGHLVPGTIKDIVPRYWTMRGKRVERRFGWDTHGLPIEMLVEKELGLNGPSDIRAYGVDRFNEACRAGVLRYVSEWRRIIGRLGRWVDFDNDYKTMDTAFMESVWWAFQRLWDEGLIYRAFRVMPYSWRLSTSLSNFEANLDYRMAQDPAATVLVQADDADEWFALWTTTPWTLPSNLAIAVGATLTYVRARRPDDDRTIIVAEDRVRDVLGEDAVIVGEPFAGQALIGRRYTPLFPYFRDRQGCFVVIAADHVTTDEGTGLVHMAPDFGEEDHVACARHGIDVVDSVDDEGRFRSVISDWAGQNIKEADAGILQALKRSGHLLRHDTIEHSVPFCWRSQTPLIYRAIPAWFVRVSELRERLTAHNAQIHWVPKTIGTKRFGNWLKDARDWNVSRSRFWGTPLPIWECTNDPSHRRCLGSVEELQAHTQRTVDDLHPHRIDDIEIACTQCEGTMHRIADVFDCWFESGAMPVAQQHYPFDHEHTFHDHFPADFITEGLDQTRGWFYTLLVLSTALFDKPPFAHCVVNGMVLAEDGSKMSKSKMNFPDPEKVLDTYGADALRAYLISSPVVRAEPLRFSEAGIRQIVRTVLLPLHNAHGFFVQYANIDGWSPDAPRMPLADRKELDRWLISHLQSLIQTIDDKMATYDLNEVVPPVLAFIDDLTNWYIRLSRRRFWRDANDDDAKADKNAAYATLYEVLMTFSKVLAPFLPFTADNLYRSLSPTADDSDSVHLADWPQVDRRAVDRELEASIRWARQAVTMGRRLRERHKLKTRQPLRSLTLVHHDASVLDAMKRHAERIATELNVREVLFSTHGDDLANMTFKANFKTLGRRYGKQMKDAAHTIESWTGAQWTTLQAGGSIDVLGQAVGPDDVIVRREAKADVLMETEDSLVAALDAHLDSDLKADGLAREFVSIVQRMRKEAAFAVTDRIEVFVDTDDGALQEALDCHRDRIAEELLACRINVTDAAGSATHLASVEGQHPLSIRIGRQA